MKRTLTSDELIAEIGEALRQEEDDLISEIANLVLVPTVAYEGDSIFTQDTEEEQ